MTASTPLHTPPPLRIVLTGGPGAGKTATLGIVQRYIGPRVAVLPEAASILFGGGFPRGADLRSRAVAQRAIYRVQVELESLPSFNDDIVTALCDRGTVDGLAYWPGDRDAFWAEVGTSHARELARYDVVVHLRTPHNGFYKRVGVRTETAEEAHAIDARIEHAWREHPRRHIIEAEHDFLAKARHVVEILEREAPGCCAVTPGS